MSDHQASQTPVRDHIMALVQTHGIIVELTPLDHMARAITECSGEPNRLDEVGFSLVRLSQAGKLSDEEARTLLIQYFYECEALKAGDAESSTLKQEE